MSYNQISSLSSIKDISQIQSLLELTLDNNPICNEASYKRNVLAHLTTIRKLDTKRVTDEEKRVAEKLFVKEQSKKREMDTLTQIEEKRKITIKDAETEWIIQQQMQNSSNQSKDLAIIGEAYNDSGFSSAGGNENADMNIKLITKTKILNLRSSTNPNRLSPQNMNNLITSSSSSSLHSSFKDTDNKSINDDDYNYVAPYQIQNSRANSATGFVRAGLPAKPNNITQITNQQVSNSNSLKRSVPLNNGSNIHEENTMFFYGNKSLDIIDIKLEQSVINQVLTISFHFIDYDECLSKFFWRLRNKFPQANSLIFTCCNIKNLNQLDCILDWKRLDSITINKEDNPIYSISIWRAYLLSRLSALQLKKLTISK